MKIIKVLLSLFNFIAGMIAEIAYSVAIMAIALMICCLFFLHI